MNRHDVDEVAAAEADVSEFPWLAGHYADSLTVGHGAWVCRMGGELVGHLVTMLAVDEAHLLNVVVRRKFQGQGFGARLLQFGLSQAKQQGAERMFLEVRPSNQRAISLYQHLGFRQVGLRRGYYPSAQGREDALVLEKGLQA